MQRAAVAGLIVVRRLGLADVGADQILERMLGEMQRPCVEPVVADRDELAPAGAAP